MLTMTAASGGTMTGPNLTDDRKMPLAVPFSFGENQLLMVVAMPIGSGASARPSAKRLSCSISGEDDRPVNAVKPEVNSMAHENNLRTPNASTAKPDGSCATA